MFVLTTVDFVQFGTDAIHLIGEGALLTAQSLSNGTVGDFVVGHPHGDNTVGVRVKFTKALEKLLKQNAVLVNLLHAGVFIREHVHEGIAGFGVGRFERKLLITKVVFAVFTIAIAGPDKLLRALAAVVILFLLTDGTGHAIEVMKLLLGARDFFLEGTTVDKAGVVFTLIFFVCHAIFSFRLLNRSGDNRYGCQF